MGYFCVFLTIALTVYGQLVFKWQITKAGAPPAALAEKLAYTFHLLMNPWIISSYVGALLASLSWLAALTRLELSFAYPFTSLSFVLILLLSGLLLREPVTVHKVVGGTLIVIGILVGSRG